jgi:hypothetical protein
MIDLLVILAVAGFLISLLPSKWPYLGSMGKRLKHFWAEVSGVATVTYVWPTPIGSTGPVTSPPTTALAAQVNEVTALIQWIDADVAATVTHNFQLPITYTFPYPNCAQFKPQVILNYISFVTGAPAALFIGSYNPTNIVVQKTNLASTAGTVLVVMRRPWQASQ